jgi:hypothetical protein
MRHVEVSHVLAPTAVPDEAASASEVGVTASLLIDRRNHVGVQQRGRLRQVELRARIVDALAREHDAGKRERAEMVVELIGVVRHLVRECNVVRRVVIEVVHHRHDHLAHLRAFGGGEVVPEVVEG